MARSTVRFTNYARTEPPPDFVASVEEVFRAVEDTIGTEQLDKGLTSDRVLQSLRPGLRYQINAYQLVSCHRDSQHNSRAGHPACRRCSSVECAQYSPSSRLVSRAPGAGTYASNHGDRTLEWCCDLEVEAGRGWMGNYRDLVQALMMVQVDHVTLAVANSYKYKTGCKSAASSDYKNTCAVADALYGHSRMALPYGLTVIGY